MTVTEQIITIGLCVAGTVATRFLPFMVFGEKRKTPKIVTYLGGVIPSAVFAMLVVYCLRNTDIFGATHGILEFAAVAFTVVLHVWKRNMFLSIAGATAMYALLLHFWG